MLFHRQLSSSWQLSQPLVALVVLRKIESGLRRAERIVYFLDSNLDVHWFMTLDKTKRAKIENLSAHSCSAPLCPAKGNFRTKRFEQHNKRELPELGSQKIAKEKK